MTFVFQDSTEMAFQNNFIDDLNVFIDIIEKILPIENKSIELNTKIRKEELRYLEETSMMENYSSELTIYLNEISKKYAIEPIGKCRDILIGMNATCIEKQKGQLKTSLDDLTRRSKDEVMEKAEQIRSELEPFLWLRIFSANKTHLITSSSEGIKGSIKMNINGFSYTYNTKYSDTKLPLKKFIDEMSIPIWSKSGLIHKEDKIKNIDISEFFIKRIYSGDDFQLDLENKKGTRKFNITIPGDISNATLMYIKEEATDITSDEELQSHLDFNKLGLIVRKIEEYIKNDNNIFSKTLTNIEIDEKDAIVNNEIFDCIKIIASQYGEIIKEIFSRGFTKNEIVIKEIKDDGTRKEIFIKVSELSNRLSALGGDGLELKDLLNL
ncbi:MAG: hypothetical protein E4G94_02175 [ANME-2 cluster archaeon]|nr:MAG: hypothetical protein E4G94_02175 [ANME-2 cluster archaeon]